MHIVIKNNNNNKNNKKNQLLCFISEFQTKIILHWEKAFEITASAAQSRRKWERRTYLLWQSSLEDGYVIVLWHAKYIWNWVL